MPENQESKDTNVKATVDAVKGLVEAIPIYQDTLQPAAKVVGKGLETIAKTVGIALLPLEALVWGYEKIREQLIGNVTNKLKDIPQENIVSPPLEVAGPAIEALRFAGYNENLRELYANLLATAMNRDTIHKAHPGFVEVIKNMSSDEAILLQAFASKTYYPSLEVRIGYTGKSSYSIIEPNFTSLDKIVNLSRPDLLQVYISNMVRLGILVISSGGPIGHKELYDSLENSEEMIQLKIKIESTPDQKFIARGGLVTLTIFGKQFVDNVVSFLNTSEERGDLRFGYPGLVLG